MPMAMKNNNFDEKIREKLDALKPTFEEQDWEKMASILRGGAATKPPALRWFKTLIYGSAAVVIGLSVAVVVWQNKENDARKTVAQTSELTQIEQQNDASTSGKENTVKVEKEKEKSGNNRQITPTISEPEQGSNVIKSKNQKTVTVTKIKTYGTTTSQSPDFNNSNAQGAKSKLFSTKNIVQNTVVEEKEKSSSSNPTGLDESKKPASELLAENATVAPSTPQTVVPTMTGADLSKTQAEKTLNRDALPFLHLINSTKVASQSVTKAEPISVAMPVAPKIDVKSIAPRASVLLGGSFAKQKNTRQVGLTIAYAPVPNLRFLSGLEYENYEKGSFKRPEDFKNRFNKDFKDILPIAPPDSVEVRNIDVRHKRWQIPLSIQGVFPLKNNFSAIAGVGTRLQFSTHNHVKFDLGEKPNKPGPPGNKPPKLSKAVHEEPSAMLQNVEFSAGIEKQWQRTILQLTPYFDYSFGKNSFDKRETPSNWGIRARIFYVLK